MKHAWILVITAACGTDRAAPPDAFSGCTVALSGNIAETSNPASCAKLAAGAGSTQGDTLLELTVPSHALGSSLAIVVDLGTAPTAGAYASGTTVVWNANAVRKVPPAGACVYRAGNSATPSGDFTLQLTAIDASSAHGELALTTYVLPRVQDDGSETDCGPGTTEAVRVRF